METLLDADTIDEAREAIRKVYAAAIEIAAPRIWRRIGSLALVAADSAEQTISDDEWDEIVTEAEDPVGDAVLDGAIAAAVTVGVMIPPGLLAARIIEHITTLTGYSPQLRAKIDRWIETTIAAEAPADLAELRRLLSEESPLSQDKADLVAEMETQAAGNGGFAVGLEASPPAAVRWVSQRDTRVRFAHAVADSETVPYGTPFIIGGYPAWYPGDPNLPFELRVNCRCELAIVEGTEVRRALGATKAELRTKAKELDISGRGKMNKGQLQHAILKALCMQGLAGGPDCPDKFDQMNRTALLTLARGQGIVGRHRMSRPQLLEALRGELRGTDPGRVAAGYATHQQTGRALKRATAKRRRLPDQEGSGRVPPIAARRSARRAVFDEFDEGDGFVPCVHCGLRLHHDPRQGLAMLVPEPIVPWSEGGTLDVSNLLPSCVSCFRARGGRGLVASADVPRDGHGRWCKGAGCSQDIGVIATPDPALFGKAPPSQRVSAPDEWFADSEDFAAAQALARAKAENVPKPSKERIAKNREIAAKAASGQGRAGGELRGNSTTRRERGEALFEEFGGKKKGHVPCTYCGIKVSPKGRGGHAHMEQDKILTLSEGGTYGTAKNFPNLIPSCGGCNRARGHKPYPVRPNWSPGKKAAATRRGLAASVFTSLMHEEVIAFPIGWNEEPDTDGEGPGVPVQGILLVRTVDAWFGSYEQWIVGGEVVDPMTVKQVE